jgi:YjbE family integral membrane protein
MQQASINEAALAPFWIAVAQIFFVNLLLSGDNAVVIAMACRGLPRRQQFWGLVIGAGAAVILRVAFTGVIAELMVLPYLKLAGGLALVFIAAKLLLPDDTDKDAVEAEAVAVARLWRAVRIVVVADIVMSLDNVIALAAIANGDLALLAIGLAISIPLIIAGAALLEALLGRFPILVWAGAGLLGWVAGETIANDPVVSDFVARAFDAKFAGNFELTVAAVGVVLVIVLGGLWRHSRLARLAKARAPAAGKSANST